MATESIFSAFGSGGGITTILMYGMYFLIALIIGACIAAMVIMFLIKKSQTKIIDIDMVNKRMEIFTGREKKRKEGTRQFWAGKLKRFLPKFQQKDLFLKGKQNAVILLKDNNGLYHTARIPTWKEMKKWYDVMYNIDITKGKDTERLRHIYLLPSPHEDLDWLANQCMEAEREFKADHWWQHPNVAYIATGFICFMMIVVTLILDKKL